MVSGRRTSPPPELASLNRSRAPVTLESSTAGTSDVPPIRQLQQRHRRISVDRRILDAWSLLRRKTQRADARILPDKESHPPASRDEWVPPLAEHTASTPTFRHRRRDFVDPFGPDEGFFNIPGKVPRISARLPTVNAALPARLRTISSAVGHWLMPCRWRGS